MSSERIFNAITDVRDELVEEAANTKLKKSRVMIMRLCAVAASFVLVIGIGGYFLTKTNMTAPPPPPVTSPGGSANGSGHADGSTEFMSYAGPVFPMTLLNGAEGVSASRDIAYDFERFGVRQENTVGLQLHPADIRIIDSYTLTNQTPNDIEVDVLYPFAGSYSDLFKLLPTINMNGNELDATLLAGQYSGGFRGVLGSGEETTHNLKLIDSWEDYRALLSDGEYLRQALSEFTELDQIVTVYEFTNPVADYEAAVNPTITARFNLDFEKTIVLGYGFHGGRVDPENNQMMQSFSVPREGFPQYGKSFYLIVIGEDISNLNIRGYVDGSCDDDKEYDGTTVDVARKEAMLGELLYTILENHMQQVYWSSGYEYQNVKDIDMYYRSAMELLTTYGVLAEGDPADRYHTGWLDDIYYETFIHQRVYYLRAQVVIPTGESVVLTVESIKQPSFDFFAGNSENMGLYGYDMVTQLGSSLTFDSVTTRLIHPEAVVIRRQNFGFDLDNDITEVALDTGIERYYLEVRSAD